MSREHTAIKRGAHAQLPPKLSLNKVLNFRKSFAFKPKVKTVAEKLSFALCIWPGNLLMDILRDSQLVIFSHSTTFITFSFKSQAGFLFNFLQSSRRWKPEVELDFCVWPLCEQGVGYMRRTAHDSSPCHFPIPSDGRVTYHADSGICFL